MFLSRALIKGKDIKKVSEHVFTFIENNVIKYINLETIDESFKNKSVNLDLQKNMGIVCTLVDNYEFDTSNNRFIIYSNNGAINTLELK